MDERLLHQHNASEFARSVRDFVWYAGQVALLAFGWHDKHKGIYLVLAVIAAVIAVTTAFASVKWGREVRRDRARNALPRR